MSNKHCFKKPKVYPSSFFFANDPGQIKFKKISSFNQKEIDSQVEGSDVVFNLIGILSESKALNLILFIQKFQK